MEPMLRLAGSGSGARWARGGSACRGSPSPDEVGALLHLLDHPEVTGPVNLTAPEPARQQEVAQALGRALHRPAVLPAPAFALRAASAGSPSRSWVASASRVTRLRESGYQLIHADLDTAVRWLVA